MSTLLLFALLSITMTKAKRGSRTGSSESDSSDSSDSSGSHSSDESSGCPCWTAEEIVTICGQEHCVSGPSEYHADSNVLWGFGIHCGDNFFRMQTTNDNTFATISCTTHAFGDYGLGQCQKTVHNINNSDNACETELGVAEVQLNCGSEWCAPQGVDCSDVTGCNNPDPKCLPVASSRQLGCGDIDCNDQQRCFIDDDCPDDEFCWIGAITLACSGDDNLLSLGLCAPRCTATPATVTFSKMVEDCKNNVHADAISVPLPVDPLPVDPNGNIVWVVSFGQAITISILAVVLIILNAVLIFRKKGEHMHNTERIDNRCIESD